MSLDQGVRFGRHHFDPRSGRLWLGDREVRLTPKAAAVLALLIERAGQTVTREELFQIVWSDVVVSDAALTSCIQELRQALGDDARRPRFIETRHRRGYRFATRIAPTVSGRAASGPASAAPASPGPAIVVGRQEVVGQLHDALERARRGRRQLVFVTGEPGLGKTTAVEAFLAGLADRAELRTGQGRCIEHYGAGEAYLPVLEALTRLCREPGGEPLLARLRAQAPTWLAQMPSLLTPAERRSLQSPTAGTTRDRMLRELAEAIEAMTADAPLLLWLEDLHWSDASTLDWLAYVARRPGPARLFLVATYRPVEVLVRAHPLRRVKAELEAHGWCRELSLDCLAETEVGDYVTARLGGARPTEDLVRLLHRRTDGHPLFMVQLVDYLLARGALVVEGGGARLHAAADGALRALPDSVRRLVEHQLDQLSPGDREILYGAGLVGSDFAAAVVAAALELPVADVEERCAAMARQEQFLRASGAAEWPDGTVSARFGFRHALYQETLTERTPEGRRTERHRRIARRLEQAYGSEAPTIAAELAMHFQRGREPDAAGRYHQHAGETALRRSAHVEAIGHLSTAVELLATLSEGPERTRREIALQLALGPAWMAAKGYAALEVERTYGRALELARRAGETPELFRVMKGLWNLHLVRAELGTARRLGEELLDLATKLGDAASIRRAHAQLGQTYFHLGELGSARTHLGLAAADAEGVPARSDARVLAYDAWTLWYQGYPDRALARSEEALAVARNRALSHDLAFVLGFAAFLRQFRREPEPTLALAEQEMELCREHGFPYWLVWGLMLRGWVLVERGQSADGIAQIREGLAGYRATGAEVGLSHFLSLLVDAHRRAAQPDAGLAVVTEAVDLAHRNGNAYHLAELYRLKGELVLDRAGRAAESEADAAFGEAIDVARRQGAKSLELRAVASLSRLRLRQDRREEARRLLADARGWFTDGLGTVDLREADALLANP